MEFKKHKYTTQLSAGLGLVEETKKILSIYSPGMSVSQIHESALSSGLFPMVTARRLRNLIAECFSPRFLKTDTAKYLKIINEIVTPICLKQLFLIYTALANQILYDFIIEVYWTKYSGGQDSIHIEDAREFVKEAVNQGKTTTIWSDTTITRVSSYLVGCCSDYGMLSSERLSERNILSFRIEDYTILFISYWLHFKGLGDNSILNHEIWMLFGMDSNNVRQEIKNISKNGWMIVQSAGDIIRISWNYKNMEEVLDVITHK